MRERIVSQSIAVGRLVILVERKVCDPCECEVVVIYQSELISEMESEFVEHFGDECR